MSLQFLLRPPSLLFRQAALRDAQVFVWVNTLFVAMAMIFKVGLPVFAVSVHIHGNQRLGVKSESCIRINGRLKVPSALPASNAMPKPVAYVVWL